jgi:hypothetical protein
MSRKALYTTNFYFNLFENKGIPGVYSTILYKECPIHINTITEHDSLKNFDTFAVELFPTYFNFHINDQYPHELRKIYRIQGYCIAIEGGENIETYLKKHFKPNFRTSMRRRLKGLEKCFNVSYRMLYGTIERDEYNFIMSELRTMLIRRFDQRNDKNMALGRWEDYYTNTFELINDKKASLFVIYDDAKPIQISLSFHQSNILFLSIPSYNIDYSKFGLGNISVFKILEWCIGNGYKTLDMGFGAFDYKVKWCNETYNFEHHLFYTKSSIRSRMLAFSFTIKTKFINYLISKKVNVYYHKVKNTMLGKKKYDLLKFDLERVDNHSELLSTYRTIHPLNDDSFTFLRRAINDFAYSQFEHVSNIGVYEFERNKIYFLQAKNKTLKVTYKI